MSSAKKILYIDTILNFGGSITSLAYLLWNLDKSKYKPYVIARSRSEFWNNSSKDIPMIIIKYGCLTDKEWVKVMISKAGRYGEVFKKTLSLLAYSLDLVFLVFPYSIRLFFAARTLNVDLIHLNNIIYRNAGGILLAKYLGIPCVAHHRGFEYHSPVVCALAKFVDHHIAISDCIKKNLLDLGVSEEKISIVPEGIDLSEYKPGKDTSLIRNEFKIDGQMLTFGLIAIFVRWKGHDIFIDAAKKVFDFLPKSRAFIIGGGAGMGKVYKDELIELTKRMGIDDRIFFTGYRRNVADFIEMLDVVVHASTQPEPFGRIIIEGMAMGKPVIASKLGAPLEIIEDGRTGILIEPNNPDKLAEAIIDLLINKEKRDAIGKLAREEAANKYSIGKHTQLIESLYDKMLGAGNV